MFNVARTMARLPPETSAALLQQALQVCAKVDMTIGTALVKTTESAMVSLRGVTRTMAAVGLAVIYLSWQAMTALRQW